MALSLVAYQRLCFLYYAQLYYKTLRLLFIGIPQGNQLFSPSNLLTDYLKQTGIMEPLITDCLNKKDGY